MASSDELTAAVKALALKAGFARAAVAPAKASDWGAGFRQWLADGCADEMGYLARNVALWLDPARLVDGAQSILCLAASYAPAAEARTSLVARYARGRDYHRVLKKRCLRLMDAVRDVAPGLRGRAFVDSAPVMERRLAAEAGLGWIGRNGCLIVPGLGSYVVLCEIVSNLPLRPDAPMEPQCRRCDACVRACPTGAFTAPPLLDARRCISGLTIEHRGAVEPSLWPRMGCRVFGCDACQETCPHNAVAPPGDTELLETRPPLGGAGLADILTWTPADWDAATRGSAARRATHEMFLRNAAIAAGNSGDPSLAGPLQRLRAVRPELGELIDWALGRLGRCGPDRRGGNPV